MSVERINSLLINKLGKLVQIRNGDVRDRTVFHPLMTPVQPLISLPQSRRVNRRVRLFGGQNKHVDEMLAPGVDKHRYVLTTQNVQTPANQGKPVIGKVLDRRREIQLAVEPGFYRVLVRGSHVGEVTG